MSDPRSAGARRPGGRRPTPRPSVDPAREVAFEVVRAVHEQDAYANLLLPQRLRATGVTGRDAAFATELVSGTLRRQGTYDAVLGACANRPLTEVDGPVLDALRLGAHQLLSMRVPTHAAVTTTVDLVRAHAGQGPTGFANAVLRRVSQHDLTAWVRRVAPDPVADPVGFASVSSSHPRWVVSAFADALAACGAPAEELDELLAADNLPPKVMLVARPGLVTVEELVAAGGRASTRSAYAVELPGGDPGAVAAVADGRAGVQDEGSQLVARAAAEAPVEGSDRRWLDLCAGPGGKAALLGALAATRGARVLAAELQPHRARLVASGTRAVGRPGMLGVLAADGRAPAWEPGSFDRVLVDAPCSGLGALRRRPESRWRRTLADVETLVPLQRQLLGAALDAVRPGGVVAYVTCSPVTAETVGVVSAALAERPDVVLEPAGGLLPGVTDAEGPLPGTVQLWPHRHGTDAMFLAVLRRR